MELFRASFIEVVEKTIEMVPCDTFNSLKEGYISSVELLETGKKVYIVANKEFLVLLSKKMIFEDNPDQETLEDLTKEFANLVVGHAKMIAEEKGEMFHISTPIYYGVSAVGEYSKAIHFKIDNTKCCSIFMKG